MATKWLTKYLVMKPEVKKIFNDLDNFRDFCRFEMLPFNEASLYNRESKEWRLYERNLNKKQKAERA